MHAPYSTSVCQRAWRCTARALVLVKNKAIESWNTLVKGMLCRSKKRRHDKNVCAFCAFMERWDSRQPWKLPAKDSQRLQIAITVQTQTHSLLGWAGQHFPSRVPRVLKHSLWQFKAIRFHPECKREIAWLSTSKTSTTRVFVLLQEPESLVRRIQ